MLSKTIIRTAVAAATVLILTGCGGATPPADGDNPSSPQQGSTEDSSSGAALSQDETCAQFNEIISIVYEEHGNADPEHYGTEVEKLSNTASKDLVRDMRVAAQAATEESVTAAEGRIDDVCQTNQYLEAKGLIDSPAPEPEPLADAEVVPVEDADGYTFNVLFEFDMGEAAKSVVNDKPGFATAEFSSATGTVAIENTTPGRKIEFSPITGVTDAFSTISYTAVYPDGSLVCTILRGTAEGECKLALMHGRIGDNGDLTLGPDELDELTTPMGHETEGGMLSVSAIPEESFTSVVSALKEPVRYELIFTGPDHWNFLTSCEDFIATAVLYTSDGSQTCDYEEHVNYQG